MRAAWAVHAPVGFAVSAGEEHLPGVYLDEEQDVVAAKHDGVHGEEVACDCGLGVQELGPCRLRTFRCRVDVVVAEYLPHGGLGDLVAEVDEFAVDSPVAPGRVLCGEADDQPA